MVWTACACTSTNPVTKCQLCSLSWRQVEVPEELQTQLRAAMETAGIPVPKSEERWEKAMTALKVHAIPLSSTSLLISHVAQPIEMLYQKPAAVFDMPISARAGSSAQLHFTLG